MPSGCGVGCVISGGQSGADRAALDFAIANEIPYSGWCPRGGWAEDLPVPPGLLGSYPLLRETPSAETRQRTLWNVRDSDATLILTEPLELPPPGTALTERAAAELARPLLVAEVLDPDGACAALRAFLALLPAGGALNVAGPRESEAPGIYARGRRLLERCLLELRRS